MVPLGIKELFTCKLTSIITIMPTIIKANTKDFAKAITLIGKTIPALRKLGNVKVSVLPNDITIYAPGIEQTVKAETEGYTDMMIPFRLLYGIAKTDKRDMLILTIIDGQIDCGGYTLASSIIKLNTVFSKKEIDLPVNSAKIDILSLRARYSPEQLREYKMLLEIESAERQLEKALLQALIYLEPYGINRNDLDELIDNKITERL